MTYNFDRPSRRTVLVAALAGAMFAGPAWAQSGDPAAIVRSIFAQYQANREPAVPWSPAVRNAMRRAEMGADPILDAQDIDVKSYTVRQISGSADRAEIEAQFVSFGRNMVGRFDFRMVDGRWTIANYRILSGTEFRQDLRKTLKMRPLP